MHSTTTSTLAQFFFKIHEDVLDVPEIRCQMRLETFFGLSSLWMINLMAVGLWVTCLLYCEVTIVEKRCLFLATVSKLVEHTLDT